MRTIFAIMLFLPSLFAGAACGADPVITFSFSGVCNGQHIAMTGINIKNITRNCDTTLSWPDTTLTLNIMGTDEYYFSENDLQVFQNVPNPVEENATVKIHAPERGLYKIQIIEFSGKIVISLNAELQKGDHRFLFTPGTSQQYLLTVACKTGSKSIKILSDFTHPHAGCRLTEIGEPSGEPVFKNSKPSGKFTFNAGDSLRFTGNFNGLFAILLDAPATNRSYLFNFISIPPAVTTSDITYIHEYIAIGGGTVTSEGSPAVTARGVCWSTSPAPTVSDEITTDGTGTGSFESILTGLTPGTEYYVRAYATNPAGTAYGIQLQFTTLVYPTLNVPGSFQGWDPGDPGTVLTSLKSNEKYEGYFWFPSNNQYKYAKGNWSLNWGDNGQDGTLDQNGENIMVPTEGYYKLNADLNSLTHSFLKTDWGVIGTATPNGWNSDTPLTYNDLAKTWNVTLDLVAGEIKFRANGSWDLNYGDDGPDGFLDQDGATIVVNAAGSYTITLDFSIPEYRYTIVKN